MIMATATAIDILAAGGGLRVSTKMMMPATLIEYAAAALSGGGRLEIVIGDTFLLPDMMVQIAAAGSGAVLFDLVSPEPDWPSPPLAP